MGILMAFAVGYFAGGRAGPALRYKNWESDCPPSRINRSTCTTRSVVSEAWFVPRTLRLPNLEIAGEVRQRLHRNYGQSNQRPPFH